MKRIILIILASLLAGPGLALAQQGAQPKQPPEEEAEPVADELPPAAIQPDPSVAPPDQGRRMAPAGANLQQQCEDQLRSDAAWRTRLRDQLTQRLLIADDEAAKELNQENLDWRARMKQELAVEIHQQDADEMATNRKHVIMAYAALWILTVLFIVYMYLRQVRLREEITRLEREIRDATK